MINRYGNRRKRTSWGARRFPANKRPEPINTVSRRDYPQGTEKLSGYSVLKKDSSAPVESNYGTSQSELNTSVSLEVLSHPQVKDAFDGYIAMMINKYHGKLSDTEITEKIKNLDAEPGHFKEALEEQLYRGYFDDNWDIDDDDKVKLLQLSQADWGKTVDAYPKRGHDSFVVKPSTPTGISSGNGRKTCKASPLEKMASAWEAYKELLLKKMDNESVAEIENSSAWTLNQLSDDTRESGSIKGLVTGSVQSGKTANMEGVISMAADHYFNFFILLSGTIENLRQQTQGRLRKDLQNTTGITWKFLDFSGEDKKVREESLNVSDLNNGYSNRTPSPTRYVTVCLKNKSRLKKLINWLYSDRVVASRLRIVVIDDEADQAGINTAKIVNDPEEQERKSINQLIVNLVNGKTADGEDPDDVSFQAMNYISYTATPYANVLNESGPESLYPKDFIYALKEPKNYFGVSVIFGNTEQNRPGLDIVNIIPKEDAKALKKRENITELPDSLKQSIAWFLCAAAVLRHRKNRKNISMLVHTAPTVEAQFEVYELIGRWLNSPTVLDLCKKVYELEKDRITQEDIRNANPDYQKIDDIQPLVETFDVIKPEIKGLLDEVTNIHFDDEQLTYSKGINLCLDNSKAQGYTANPDMEHLRIVYPTDDQLASMSQAPAFIVVGGNTLARGLTLEGLVCTYFSRDSNQADALMQMGRWFGYRFGFELLQRVWLTEAELDKFRSMAIMDYEMKREIQKFVDENLKPADFGPKLYTMPEIAKFKLTAANKMQKAVAAEFDFEGANTETTAFDDDPKILANNIEIFKNFVKELTSLPETSLVTGTKSFVYRNVPANIVVDTFFKGKFHISSQSTVSKEKDHFMAWLYKKNEEGNYTSWDVAVIQGTNPEDPWDLGLSESLKAINRTKKKDITDYINIGSLRSGLDVLCDVDATGLTDDQKAELEHAKKEKKDLIMKRSAFNLAGIPLLLLYRISKDGGKDTKYRSVIGTKKDLIGFSVIISGLKKADHTSFVRVEKMN